MKQDKAPATESAPVRCATCGATHRYDCPHIDQWAFMIAVMEDTTVPIQDRRYAQAALRELMKLGIYPPFVEDAPVPVPSKPNLRFINPDSKWVQ